MLFTTRFVCAFNCINVLFVRSQLSEAEKEDVPEHVKKAAREMNRKAFEERLKEIRMSEYDAKLYGQFLKAVQPQVTQGSRLLAFGVPTRNMSVN